MKRFYAFVLAISFAISGFLFDSELTKSSLISYPFFHVALAGVGVFVLFLAQGGRLILPDQVKFVSLIFLFIYTIGLFSSIISGAGSVLAFGMKTITLFFNFIFFMFAYTLYGGYFFRKFGSYILFISLIFSSFLIFQDGFNKNWIGITVLYSYMFWIVTTDKYNDFVFMMGFILIALCSFVILAARGVSIAAFLAALYFIFTAFFPKKINHHFSKIIFFTMPLVGLLVSIVGVWVYRSTYYEELTGLSIENTGKNLDSGRLGRWDLGYELFLEKPILGWGVDAHISRAGQAVEGLGDLHNIWWEFAFRFGSLGMLALLTILYYLFYLESKSNSGVKDVAIYLVLSVFLSVYALGGVTHWPGAFMFWLMIGVLMKRSTINRPRGFYDNTAR